MARSDIPWERTERKERERETKEEKEEDVWDASKLL